MYRELYSALRGNFLLNNNLNPLLKNSQTQTQLKKLVLGPKVRIIKLCFYLFLYDVAKDKYVVYVINI